MRDFLNIDMNKYLIRDYCPADLAQVCQQMELFQQYLTDLDTMELLLVDQDYGIKYTELTLKSVAQQQGEFVVACLAEAPEKVVGFGVGIIPQKLFPFDKLGHKPKKEGIVSELFLLEEYRGRGISRMIISELEKHFVAMGCNYCRIGVMKDNNSAHAAYLKMGYQDRYVELLRKIGGEN